MRTSPKRSNALLVNKISEGEKKSGLIDFKVGNDIKCNVTITEGNKTRIQAYQGVIIAMHKSAKMSHSSDSITVRKVVQGVGVERVFPIHSPLVTFENLAGAGEPVVRRAKLYYLRKLKGKKARLKRVYRGVKPMKAREAPETVETAEVETEVEVETEA